MNNLVRRLFATKVGGKTGPNAYTIVERKADMMQKIPHNVKAMIDQ
jgi:hypothetical protein